MNAQIRVSNTLLLTIVATVLSVHSAVGQPITRAVPFTLSARDTSATPFLPHIEEGPAGKHGPWHLTPDGHYEAADGTHMRFVGTELQWNASFQTGANARILAGRLAKLGFNAVHLYAWDYWGYDDYSFFRTYEDKGNVQSSSYVINPLQLARFDTLLYELKRAGIYVFIPLHSVHRYASGDGVPTWDSVYYNGFLMPILYKEAAEKERQFAHWLAAHVNPLTGLALGQDPQVACYEIASEFTVPFYWQLGRLNYVDTNNALTRGTATISWHQSRHLDTLFNGYLRTKYGSDAAIDAAWRGSASVSTANLLENASFESFDMNRWTLTNVAPARSNALLVSPGQDASPAVMIHISGIDTTHRYYGNIFTNASATMGRDSLYLYSFWAKLRVDPQHPVTTRTIYAYIAATETGSGNLATQFSIDTNWKKYSFTVRCTYGGAQTIGVLFSGDYGDVVLDNFSLVRQRDPGLRPGESLTGVMIQRISFADMKNVSAARARDLTMFYDDLERGYFDLLQRTLRDTLHVAGLVNRTQSNYWGTLLDFHAQKDAEVTVSRGGWDYLSARPNKTYSDSTWMIRNYALVKDGGFGALAQSAATSVIGKSHVMGSWSVPNLNQSSSSNAIIPMAYASLQDWDGIFFSPYAVRRDEVLADSIIPGYATSAWSNIAPNHAFMALMPAVSYAFRNRQIAASSILDTIQHDAGDVFLLPHYSDYRGIFGLEGFQGGDQGIVTSMRVRQRYNARHQLAAENFYTPGDSLNRSETGEITYAATQSYFRVEAPKLYAYTGYPRGDIDFPRLKLRRTDNSGDILTFLYQSDSIGTRHLLSLTTRVQNTGTRWLDTLGYGKNTGHAPTLLSAASFTLTIPSDMQRITIQPLDSTGHPMGSAIIATPAGQGEFTATIDQLQTPSAWFLITETDNSSVEDADAAARPSFRIVANPVMDRLRLIATEDIRRIDIYDELGRSVIQQDANSSRAELDTRLLPAGSYTAEVRTSNGDRLRKRFSVIH